MKKSRAFGKAPYKKYVLLGNFLLILLSVAVVTFYNLPAAVAQEKQEQQDVSKEEIEKYKEIKKAAKKEKVEKAAKKDKTGTDPRVFSDKWMPYYRYTKLENGLIQQDLTAFGTFRFNDRLGMFYEVPLAQYRDFSDVPGVPAGTDAIGMGDIDLKFLWRPEALEFSYGKEGKKSASVLLGTDFLLPTATDDALAGDAFLFAPIVAFVFDMPFHGFIASLNLYFFDVYKEDSAPKTSRYVGKWFYMQPLTKPGPWWGGFFLLPEFQPIYDFETNDFSAWIGVELGKMLAPGRIAYIKPGWGIDNSEPTDRKSTIEVGFRWFF
jgi:cell division protein FtsB